MLRVISHIRSSLSQTLIPVHNSLSSPLSYLPTRQRHRGANSEEDNRDPDSPPKLFVVQPRLRPDTLLNSKLAEALNLANSLEDEREGISYTDKELPSHVVVQNPAARSPRAGGWVSITFFIVMLFLAVLVRADRPFPLLRFPFGEVLC